MKIKIKNFVARIVAKPLILTTLVICCIMTSNNKVLGQCNVAPLLLQQGIVNGDCYTINLNSLVSSSIPPNSTLQWFTNSTHSGTPYNSVNNAAAGIYFAFFFDANNNCYSPASEPIFVTKDPCPCTNAANAATSINSDIYSGTYNQTALHIIKDITIYGNSTFFATDIFIEPGVTITIDNSAFASFRFTHLHCCTGMWQGINVLEGGRLLLTEDADFLTVIEDAVIAVNFNFPSHHLQANDYLLKSTGALFNRNETAIAINNFFFNETSQAQLPFYISNSVFTCRDIPFDYTTSYGSFSNKFDAAATYPNIANFATIPQITPPLVLASPFFNNPIFPCPDNTINAFLKRNLRNEKSSYGIVLNNLCEGGTFINIGSSQTPSLFGTQNLRYTLFDNIDIGIDATSTKLHLNNCIFQKPFSTSPHRIGLNLHDEGVVETPTLTVNNTDPQGNAALMENGFYDCSVGIQVADFNQVTIKDCNIRSNQSKGLSNTFGQNGIVIDGYNVQHIDVSNNHINNINTPIYYRNDGADAGMQLDIKINNNFIEAQLPGVAPTNNEFMNTAITLIGTGEQNLSINPDLLPIVCNNNIITGAYTGISGWGFLQKSIDCELNTINLWQQTASLKNPNPAQFGIRFNNGTAAVNAGTAIRNIVQNNYVGGNSCGNCNQTGIYLSTQHLTDVNCNKAENMQYGYRFLGRSDITHFFDNTIEPNNVYGFTLDAGGQIGAQGFNSNKNGKCNSNNNWSMPTSTWFSGFATHHYMTFVRSATATLSPLYVGLNANTNGNTTNPNGSGFASPANLAVYSQPNSIKSQGAGAPSSRCFHCVHSLNPNTNARTDSAMEEQEAIMTSVADGTIDLTDDDPLQRLYVMQQELYEQLLSAGSHYANNTTLQDFMVNNTLGSFDYIHYVQEYLNQGDLATVDLLLSSFPSDNIVDDNYYIYYNWVVNMTNDPNYAPNIDDVYAMSSLCPAKNGNVVYKARTLYSKLTKTGEMFADECPESAAARQAHQAIAAAPMQQTKQLLYPNPATDIINISNPNVEVAYITVCDIAGKQLLKQYCSGTALETMNIGKLNTGVYVLQLQKTDGSVVTQKLIKQ